MNEGHCNKYCLLLTVLLLSQLKDFFLIQEIFIEGSVLLQGPSLLLLATSLTFLFRVTRTPLIFGYTALVIQQNLLFGFVGVRGWSVVLGCITPQRSCLDCRPVSCCWTFRDHETEALWEIIWPWAITGFHCCGYMTSLPEGNWLGRRNKRRPLRENTQVRGCLAVQAMVRGSRGPGGKGNCVWSLEVIILPPPPAYTSVLEELINSWFLACCLSNLPHLPPWPL